MENTFTCRVILSDGSIIRIKDAENYIHKAAEKVFVVETKLGNNIFNEAFTMCVMREEDLINK